MPWEDPTNDRVGNILLSRMMGADSRLDPHGFDIGIRDSWKDALAEVEAEVQRLTEERRVKDLEGVADLLRMLGDLTTAEVEQRGGEATWLVELEGQRRALRVRIAGEERWVAVEDAGRLRDALGAALRPAAAGDEPLVRYACDLQVPRLLRAEVALLKAVALRYVMADPVRRRIQDRQRELLVELVQALADRGGPGLDPLFALQYESAADDAGRLRAVLDQVSLLTDAQAVTRHRTLLG